MCGIPEACEVKVTDDLVEGRGVPGVEEVVGIFKVAYMGQTGALGREKSSPERCSLVYTLEAISAARTLYVTRCIGWKGSISTETVEGGSDASASIMCGLKVSSKYRPAKRYGNIRMLDHRHAHQIPQPSDSAKFGPLFPTKQPGDFLIECVLRTKRLRSEEAANHNSYPHRVVDVSLRPRYVLGGRRGCFARRDRRRRLRLAALLQVLCGCFRQGCQRNLAKQLEDSLPDTIHRRWTLSDMASLIALLVTEPATWPSSVRLASLGILVLSVILPKMIRFHLAFVNSDGSLFRSIRRIVSS